MKYLTLSSGSNRSLKCNKDSKTSYRRPLKLSDGVSFSVLMLMDVLIVLGGFLFVTEASHCDLNKQKKTEVGLGVSPQLAVCRDRLPLHFNSG